MATFVYLAKKEILGITLMSKIIFNFQTALLRFSYLHCPIEMEKEVLYCV